MSIIYAPPGGGGEDTKNTPLETRANLETFSGADRLSADKIKDGSANKFSNDSDRNTWLSGKSTDNITEGAANKYNVDQIFPDFFACDRLDFKVTAGNAFALLNNVIYYNGYLARQDAAANGDTTEISVLIGSGTYDFIFLGGTGSNSPIVDLYVDGAEITGGAVDWYEGSGQTSVKTVSSISISTSGKHTIALKVDGTNGADYYFNLYRMIIRKS